MFVNICKEQNIYGGDDINSVSEWKFQILAANEVALNYQRLPTQYEKNFQNMFIFGGDVDKGRFVVS